MLPGRGILTTLLDFLGTGIWSKPSNVRPSKSGFPGVDSNPRPCSGALRPANFPRPEAWGIYTRQPRVLTAAPGLGRTQDSGEARAAKLRSNERRPPRPSS